MEASRVTFLCGHIEQRVMLSGRLRDQNPVCGPDSCKTGRLTAPLGSETDDLCRRAETFFCPGTQLEARARICNGDLLMQVRSERGAIIIQVAVALLMLLAFTTFVVDQGLMFVARGQAQNAADAGALAGAITMMNNPGDFTEADLAAKHFAGQPNTIWGQQTANADIVVSPLPMTCPPDVGGGDACIRVDVMRGMPDRAGTPHTNTLPTFFGPLINVDSQGVRATATAQVAAGNSVSCIKPWMVVDKWIDNTTPSATNPAGWDQDDTFSLADGDVYVKPGFTASGPNNDIGLRLMLKGDNEWSAGWSMRVELGGGNGAATYMDEIQGCPEWVPDIGFYDGPEPCTTREHQDFPSGCINVRPGVSQGPTVKHGVDHLVGLDSSASWDETNKKIVGGCTDAGTCAGIDPEGDDFSPRIIPLALFNPQACVESSCQTGNNTVAQVVNIMGFFLEGTCDDLYPSNATPSWCGAHPNQTVVGRIMNYPAQASSAAGSAGPWSFLKVVRLIR